MALGILSGDVVKLQLATDGRWEDALHIQRDGIRMERISEWLEQASQDLALEAFFPAPHGLAFIGVRFSSLPKEIQHSVITATANHFLTTATISAKQVMEHIEQMTRSQLFRNSPHVLEVGKVNAWRSFGPAVFWPNAFGHRPKEGFNEVMSRNSRYREPSQLPLAIEMQFRSNLPHWFAYPISILNDGHYLLQDELVDIALEYFDAGPM